MSESLQIKGAFSYLEFLNGCLPCVSTPPHPIMIVAAFPWRLGPLGCHLGSFSFTHPRVSDSHLGVEATKP